jgi:hypothetical protein
MKNVFLLMLLVAAACKGEPRPGDCEVIDATVVPNEGWTHVKEEAECVYQHNPPASGPHLSMWAGYKVHDEVVSRCNWVHNLEHGAVVMLIGPEVSAAQRQLILDAYAALPNDPDCLHNRALVTEDPLLEAPFAVVAADRVLFGPGPSLDEIVAFAEACRDRAPEDVCF